jgi:hypothetical protein
MVVGEWPRLCRWPSHGTRALGQTSAPPQFCFGLGLSSSRPPPSPPPPRYTATNVRQRMYGRPEGGRAEPARFHVKHRTQTTGAAERDSAERIAKTLDSFEISVRAVDTLDGYFRHHQCVTTAYRPMLLAGSHPMKPQEDTRAVAPHRAATKMQCPAPVCPRKPGQNGDGRNIESSHQSHLELRTDLQVFGFIPFCRYVLLAAS